jgi:hypothetical protein
MLKGEFTFQHIAQWHPRPVVSRSVYRASCGKPINMFPDAKMKPACQSIWIVPTTFT